MSKLPDNLLDLDDPGEEAVLNLLGNRFKSRRIYTKLGNVLIAVNINEKLPIYDSPVVEQHKHESGSEAHIFTAAESAYNCLREGNNNHTLLFSGESGSGKSHNAFAALRYLVQVAPSKKNRITLEAIDAIQAVLGSFVCAKTAKSESATRIGYSLDLLYKSSFLEGFSMKTVLPVEHSRIMSRASGEGCFSVFSEILAGLDGERGTELGMKNDHKFFYMAAVTIDGARDASGFQRLVSALRTLGFSDEQRHFIFSILIAILHLGNIYFTKKKNPTTNQDYVEIANESELKWLAIILGVDAKKWASLFTAKTVKGESEGKVHNFTMDQALDTRDSLAGILYEELLNWIFGRISSFFKCSDSTGCISVVDFYGFERYNKNNGYDQLLINTANELIEQFICNEIFDKEAELYAKENITITTQSTSCSNLKTVDLLTKKPYGILHLLDDECKFPKASDDSFLQHCNLNHLDCDAYEKTRNKEKPEFSVAHFCGVTWYKARGFLTSNRRSINRKFLDQLCSSSNVVVAALFRGMFVSRAKEEYTQLGGTNLINSVSALLEKLRISSCQFIRCLRANSEQAVGKFDAAIVQRQMRAYSMLDTLYFRRSGYPIKLNLDEFVTKYRCLLPSIITSNQKRHEILKDVLELQGYEYKDDFKIGTEHVFLRERLAKKLTLERNDVIERSAFIVQRTTKAAIRRRKFLRQRNAVIKLQSAYRRWKAGKEMIIMRQGIMKDLETEAKRHSTGILLTYREVIQTDAASVNDEISRSVLGPTKYLDNDAEMACGKPITEELEVKKTSAYLSIPAEMQRPTVQVMTIEAFAEKHFKGHILEVRREPIQTPFLPKDNDVHFEMALDMFKLVLKYTNDASLTRPQQHELGSRIVQLAIDNVIMRDELFVQLCNQTYKNQNKAFCDRAWTLMLMAVYAFPPSISVLPMLLHYFVHQSNPLSNFLMEGLVRKIRTVDVKASRIYAANRLEHAAFSASAPPVVQVHLTDSDHCLVEAHPWATAEEVAMRALRQRGMGEPEGWSVVVETEEEIVCPTSGHFLHDAIATIENRGQTEEISSFFRFPNVRTLPATSKPAASTSPLPRKRLSPVEKKKERSNPPSRTNSIKEESRNETNKKISPVPTPRQSIALPNDEPKSDEGENSLSIKGGSSSASTPNSHSVGEGRESVSGERREIMVDEEKPESDYCYTLPNKSTPTRRYLDRETSPGLEGRYYSQGENVLYTLSPPPLPTQSVLDKYHNQQMAYGSMAPPQQVQYIQYVPVVVSQPLITSPLFAHSANNNTVLGSSAGSSHVPQMFAAQLPQQQFYQSIISPNGQPQFIPQLSSSPLVGPEADERIRNAMIRHPSSGIETPTVMSVASRIRRMPVPSQNCDVDRFLDEVFQQVLTPEMSGMDSISSERLASSIRGGVRAKQDTSMTLPPPPSRLPLQQHVYYDPPVFQDGFYHSVEYPNNRFHSLPPKGREKSGSSGSSSTPRRSPSQNSRRHSDDQRKGISVWPVNGGPQFPVLIPDTDYSASTFPPTSIAEMDARMIGEGQRMPHFPGLIGMPMTAPSYVGLGGSMHPTPSECTQPYQQPAGLMYGEIGVARYGVNPPLSRMTVAEEVDIPMSRASTVGPPPTAAPRGLPRNGTTNANVVQGAILNSEHPTVGKLYNPAKQIAKVQVEKEKEALAKIAEKQKRLPPPVEEVKVQRPKPKMLPVVVPPIVHIPDEPDEEIVIVPARVPSPERPRPQSRQIRRPAPVVFDNPPQRVARQEIEQRPPENEWIFDFEVERPKAVQNVIVEKGPQAEARNGRDDEYDHNPYAPPAANRNGNGISYTPPQPQQIQAQRAPPRERLAVHAPKQPWKLTIRKMNFLPGEKLDDEQLIDQVFSQIIDDCRRAIAYRIRAAERDNVTAILKKHQIHPDLLNRQYEIPADVKVEVIEAARSWPLYFNQIFEVIEERAAENVFILLAVGETGLRLLIHNPENTQNPLVVQDHFEYADIKDVMLEERHLLTIRTRSNMLVHLRTEQAGQIRSLIERYLFGAAKPRKFVIASSDYITKELDHLSFSRGDRIELVEKAGVPNGWMHGRIHNRYGIFPSEHVVAEHYDERGNHPDVKAVGQGNVVYEEATEEAYGYEYADEGEGKEKFTMLEFAMHYFRPPRGEKRKDWSWKEAAKKIMWIDRPMQNSLLRLEGQDANKLACDIFLCMMKFMSDEPLKRGETYTDVVYRIFMILRKVETLRDEAYCQIVRQTTSNRSERPESAMRGWRLFSILTSFFGCSVVLKPYLTKHLYDLAHDPRRAFHGTAKLCLDNLNKTFKYGGRKFLLSGTEIEQLTRGKSVKRQVYNLPGGHKKVVNTSAVTVVEEIVKELCAELNIRSPSEQQEFVLCALLENDRDVYFATNDEYILDICTELEHQKQSYSFFLRRAVWIHPLRLDSALYIDAMYFQILPDYLTGLLVSPQNNGNFSASTLDDIAKLSAYVYLGNEQLRKAPLEEDGVVQIVPQTALLSRMVTEGMWIDRIERKLRGMDSIVSVSHARAAFLEIVEQWPTFGASFYRVLTTTEKEREIAETILCMSKSGLKLLTADNYRIVAEYTLSSIGPVKKFSRGESQYIDITIRGADRDFRITVQSEKCGEIALLIAQYLFVYNATKRTGADPTRN